MVSHRYRLLILAILVSSGRIETINIDSNIFDSEYLYFVNPGIGNECSDIINGLPISYSSECSHVASSQLQNSIQSKRFVMDVKKQDLPKGCLMSKFMTIWWNEDGHKYRRESNSNFYLICKYRKIFYDNGEFSNLCSKYEVGGKPGDGLGSTQGNCESGQLCYGGGKCSDLCSKYAQNGTPGDGNGSGQGNCEIGQYCYRGKPCETKCSKYRKNGEAGDGVGNTRGNCLDGQWCYHGGNCSDKCSKHASRIGKAGDGDGSSQGNCGNGKICYANGHCSEQCSRSSTYGVSGDGDGSGQGNCLSSQFCYRNGICSNKCSKSPSGGVAGDGKGDSKGNCMFENFCYSNGQCSSRCSKSPKGGIPGDGTSYSQGNCAPGEFCFADGVCSAKPYHLHDDYGGVTFYPNITRRGKASYIGMDPNGTYTSSPSPFEVKHLRIEADILKDRYRSNHFFLITSIPNYHGGWTWDKQPTVLEIGWNSDIVYIIGPSQDTFAESSSRTTHHLSMIYTPTTIEVGTDIDNVDIALRGRYWSKVWIWIGADDDENEGSDFSNVEINPSGTQDDLNQTELDNVLRTYNIFKLEGKNELECSQQNGKTIFVCHECKIAAEELGMTYKGVENVNNYPKGCYAILPSSVYCNTSSVGSKRASSSPICISRK